MKRRSFLAALFAAPMVPVAAKASVEKLSIDAAPMRVSERADGLPLVYEDGILKIQNANVGAVMTGGVWKSAGGEMRFDLTNHTVVLIR